MYDYDKWSFASLTLTAQIIINEYIIDCIVIPFYDFILVNYRQLNYFIKASLFQIYRILFSNSSFLFVSITFSLTPFS